MQIWVQKEVARLQDSCLHASSPGSLRLQGHIDMNLGGCPGKTFKDIYSLGTLFWVGSKIKTFLWVLVGEGDGVPVWCVLSRSEHSTVVRLVRTSEPADSLLHSQCVHFQGILEAHSTPRRNIYKYRSICQTQRLSWVWANCFVSGHLDSYSFPFPWKFIKH